MITIITVMIDSNTRTHGFSKLTDDGEPRAPNNFLKSCAKEKTPVKPRSAKQQTISSGKLKLLYLNEHDYNGVTLKLRQVIK